MIVKDGLCWSRGPRIGNSGVPYCKLPDNHTGPHAPHVLDGWGNHMSWEGPDMKEQWRGESKIAEHGWWANSSAGSVAHWVVGNEHTYPVCNRAVLHRSAYLWTDGPKCKRCIDTGLTPIGKTILTPPPVLPVLESLAQILAGAFFPEPELPGKWEEVASGVITELEKRGYKITPNSF